MRLLPLYPPHAPPAPLAREVPGTRGRGRPGVVGLVQGRFRALGPDQLCASRDAKSGLGRGSHGGDAGGLEAAPGRTEVPGPGRA